MILYVYKMKDKHRVYILFMEVYVKVSSVKRVYIFNGSWYFEAIVDNNCSQSPWYESWYLLPCLSSLVTVERMVSSLSHSTGTWRQAGRSEHLRTDSYLKILTAFKLCHVIVG